MRRGLAAGVGLTLLLAGCGSQKNYANNPRPPAAASVTAAVFPGRITISPTQLGAGPINVTIANLSKKSLEVTLSSVGGNQADSNSGPINPQGTATISTTVKRGAYVLKSSKGGSVSLAVGRARKSAQDQVLLP